MVIKKITLKVWNKNYVCLYANHNEVNARFLEVSLRDHDSMVNLANKTVIIYAKKPDGSVVINECEITDPASGIFLMNLTSEMTSVAGILNCEFHIVDTQNSKVLKVVGLKVIIISVGNINKSIKSSSEYLALKSMIKKLETLIGTVEVSGIHRHLKKVITVAESDWNYDATDDFYYCELTNNFTGVLSNDNVFTDIALSDLIPLAKQELAEYSKIVKQKVEDGRITLFCFDDAPSIDLNILFTIYR